MEGIFTLNQIVKSLQAEDVWLWTLKKINKTISPSTASVAVGDDPPIIALEQAWLIQESSTTSATTTTTSSTNPYGEVPQKGQYWTMMQKMVPYNIGYLQTRRDVAATMTIASPCVVTVTGHGLSAGHLVSFGTDGALPTGVTADTLYYVFSTPSTDTFQISSDGVSAINTSGTQSGSHTVRFIDSGINGSYYDGMNCMARMADYFTDTTTYYAYMDEMAYWYRDKWVNALATPGQVAGYYNFSDGLIQDYLRQGTAASLTALNNLLTNGLYVNTNAADDNIMTDHKRSREVAYSLNLFIQAEKSIDSITLTGTQTARRDYLFECALNHIDLWCVSKTATYFRPFMGAITAKSLIAYYEEVSEDSRIIPALEILAQYMLDACYEEGPIADLSGYTQMYSFRYTDRVLDTGLSYSDANDGYVAPDLNMMICPLFGWLYMKTGTTKWREYGDKIFEGGISVYDTYGAYVSGAYLGVQSNANTNGKQINQQLFWGPKYIEWAESDAETEVVIESPTSSTETKTELKIIPYREYLAIEDKGDDGEPTHITLSGGQSPYLYVWRVPQTTGYSVELYGVSKLKDWDDSTSTGDFPVKFQRALIYQLAADLADLYAPKRAAALQNKAAYLMNLAKLSEHNVQEETFIKGTY